MAQRQSRGEFHRWTAAQTRGETRIIRSGSVELDPPGIRLNLDEIYGD
jgi:hypothetical protein